MKKSKKVYIILGTRAQFIKMAPIMVEMRKRNLPYTLIYTAQHRENVQEILDAYGLREPDLNIYEGEESNTMSKGFKWMFDMLFKALFKAKKYLPEKGIVLTHGDTFTAWLAALMGKRAGCKVGHVESGLRSFNIFSPFPEEISRLITFRFSDVYFCADEWSMNNLKKYKGEKINIGANTMLDGVKFAVESKNKTKLSFQKEPYVLVSIHRYENIFKDRFTTVIIPYLKDISKKHKLVVTLHPTTRERLKELGLYDALEKDERITLHKRFDFVDWINVCNDAEFVITDGGSNQEELSYLGIPTLLFRDHTERKEGLGENVVLSMFEKDIINEFVNNYKDYKREPLFRKVYPSAQIADYLVREGYGSEK